MRKNLYMLRHAHGLTQEKMAKRLGVSRTAYRNIESGQSNGSIEFWLAVVREFPEADISEITKTEERADREEQTKNHTE